MRTTSTARRKYLLYVKLTFAVMLMVALSAAFPSSTAYAKKKKANYGTIKILTTPGGFPIEVDGKPQGETTTSYRAFDLNPGIHNIVVSLPDGQRWIREINLEAGRIKCVAVNYKPALPRPPASLCPFPISLSAPATVNDGEIITFTSNVAYGGTSALNYRWTVSPANARILSGAGTPTLTVDTTGFADRTITAILLVDDGSGEAACRQSAQALTFIPPLPARINRAREFDVCNNCAFDDQKARLDNLGIELNNEPSATAYILAYGGRTSRNGQADWLAARARDYLVTHRGIGSSRIVVTNGGFREEEAVESWIVPSGATPPQPRPTVQASDVRPTRETPRRKRRD